MVSRYTFTRRDMLVKTVTTTSLFSAAAAFDRLCAADNSSGKNRKEVPVYVGTYTRGRNGSKGIYRLSLNLQTGELTSKGLAAEAANPSFLALHPEKPLLYAVAETATTGGRKGGAVSAFRIEADSGRLTPINQASSRGNGPCYVAVDQSGRCVLTANYGSGTIASLPLRADGGLKPAATSIQHKGSGPNTKRQKGPHAHSIKVTPDNRFALAADLGTDKLYLYRLDSEKGTITPHTPSFAALPPGSGPRHFDFHPNKRFLFVMNELASTVTTFSFEEKTGALDLLHTISTLPDDFKGSNTTADIHVHPSGRFVYGSNRGHDSIAVFRVDEKTGKLTLAGCRKSGGRTPRNFALDPTGRFLLAANQNSDNIVVFSINQENGSLTPAGYSISIPKPVCVRFRPGR